MTQVAAPFQQFFDLDGGPLNNGYIYIGTAGANPITSSITLYWDEDATLPAAQPLRTINGYISRAGSPAIVYTNESNYSILVRNSAQALVYSVLEAFPTIGYTGYIVENIAALVALPLALVTGDVVKVLGYYNAGDLGGGDFRYDSASAATANDGTVIDPSALSGRFLRINVVDYIPQMFGAIPDGTTSNSTNLNKYFTYINTYLLGSNPNVLYTGTYSTVTARIPAGHYRIDAPIELGAFITVECDDRAMFSLQTAYTGIMFYSTSPYRINWSGGIFIAPTIGTGGIWWLGPTNFPTSTINLDQGLIVFEKFEAKGFLDIFPVLNNRSAHVVIRDFKSDQCTHIIGRGNNLNTSTGAYSQTAPLSGYGGICDRIDVGPAWITASTVMSTDFDAVFCADTLKLKELLLVPAPHTGVECAWVNLWTGNLLVESVRVGGESGSMAVVNYMGDFLTVYPAAPTSIILDNSALFCTETLTTTLATTVNSSTTTFVLTDASKFPSEGTFTIESEQVDYTSKAGNTITSSARNLFSAAHLAGVTVTHQKGVFIRLVNNTPNNITISNCFGGTDSKAYVDLSYACTAHSTIATNMNSTSFTYSFSNNSFQTMIGQLPNFIRNNTTIKSFEREAVTSTLTTAGSPGLIRFRCNRVLPSRAGAYLVSFVIIEASGYRQTVQGTLTIHHFYTGAVTSIYGYFTKTADPAVIIPGAPMDMDIIDVKFMYPNGSLTAANILPMADRYIAFPTLEVSASTGNVGANDVGRAVIIEI